MAPTKNANNKKITAPKEKKEKAAPKAAATDPTLQALGKGKSKGHSPFCQRNSESKNRKYTTTNHSPDPN